MTIRKPAAQHAPIAHGVLTDSIGYRLHLADLVNMQGIGRALAGTGVTAARFTALELIASNPGIKPASLATAMMVERSNLVGLVRFLSEQGWVRSVAGPNRREKSLELTAAGGVALRDLRRGRPRTEARWGPGCRPPSATNCRACSSGWWEHGRRPRAPSGLSRRRRPPGRPGSRRPPARSASDPRRVAPPAGRRACRGCRCSGRGPGTGRRVPC